MRRRTPLAWAVGLGVGLAAGLVSALVPGHVAAAPDASTAPAKLAPPGDRVRAAIAGVEKDHLYLAPEVSADLTAPQLAKLRAILAKAPVPTYVVYWGDDTQVAPDGGYETDYDALDQLAAGVGKEGFYAVTATDGLVEAKAIGYEDPAPDVYDIKGRPYQALARYLTALVKVTPERPAPPSKDTVDEWGGSVGGFTAGLVFAIPPFFVLIGLVALAGWVRRVWRSS